MKEKEFTDAILSVGEIVIDEVIIRHSDVRGVYAHKKDGTCLMWDCFGRGFSAKSDPSKTDNIDPKNDIWCWERDRVFDINI